MNLSGKTHLADIMKTFRSYRFTNDILTANACK